ncbi:hypothetical protein IQ268_22395 [Oculatella sp. LEGE 06141]|uniref:DUF7734 family protein n=1 Tax=Oculatella sp. LEGE 06141 TaxID=1828648 RepID=UPI001881A96B|nr:hypothetical protein [Oculatella sp. LEGE 06141]
MAASLGYRLEQYTLKRPHEVLMVTVDLGADIDQIVIFKGFSSSLVNPTAFDPDIPVLPDNATITAIDRLESPYHPQHPRYIQQGLTWAEMQELLAEVGL